MRLIFSITICFISLSINAQYWIQKSSFGGVGRHRAVGCATAFKGYLGLGHVNGSGVDYSYKDWWEYDPSADSWSQKASFPVNNHGATCFVVDNQPCVGGGSALNGEFYKFDPNQNTWTPIASCPFFNPGDTQGFSVNNRGYVYVGQQMAEYNPGTNSWALTAPPPVAFGSWTCSFTIEGSGYVKAGTKLYEYKPLHNTWTQRADFPGSSTGGSYGFAIQQKGFVTCGYVGGLSTVTDQVWSFYPGTNSWHLELAFPGITRRFPVAFALHDRGYFGTGTNGINLNDFWQYNPTINTAELMDEKSISISTYPNPCSDVLNIEVDRHLSVDLVDYTGRMLTRVDLQPGKNQMDLSLFPSGDYLLRSDNQGVYATAHVKIIHK